MKKKDLLIIGTALLLAALIYVATQLGKAPPAYAVIYVGDAVYRTVPLDEYGSVTIDQGDGKLNVVTIDENGVHMASSTCKNQLCVRQGAISPDGAEDLPLGRWIICLPNGVSVELTENAK
ncbi:MAG TPA: NusG domain II-containing protein [Clostridia bacterium]|nr:NusG domain II-containing protein [Clostridia bacterium]